MPDVYISSVVQLVDELWTQFTVYVSSGFPLMPSFQAIVTDVLVMAVSVTQVGSPASIQVLTSAGAALHKDPGAFSAITQH